MAMISTATQDTATYTTARKLRMHIADGTVGGAVNEEGMTKNGEDIGTTQMDTLVPVTIDIEDGEVAFSFSSLRQLLSLARICRWLLLICQTPFLSGGCSPSVPHPGCMWTADPFAKGSTDWASNHAKLHVM